MNQWIREELSKCLCFEIPDAMISYIHTIQDSHEIDEYFRTLLDFNNPEHVTFLSELKSKLRHRKNDSGPNVQQVKQSSSKPSAQGGGKSKRANGNEAQQASKPTANSGPAPVAAGQGVMPTGAQNTSKKKTKFVNLYGQDGELANVVMLKGRHHCDCQASKHKLVNNCLHCGRIVCEQEGSGPCLFCGTLVCTEDEMRLIESSSRKGDSLRRSLMEQNRPAGWAEALATRNRLLEYDRNSEKRTTVIDDEADYFKTNSVWLSDAERQKLETLEAELREKRHASRMSRKITLDFAGRQIVDEPELTAEMEESIIKKALDDKENTVPNDYTAQYTNLNSDMDLHPMFNGPVPTFVNIDNLSNQQAAPSPVVRQAGFDGVYSRVQDKEFLEMSDMRHCLSMHQPWASLLVAGIKRHEGRTWYSSHRGRLWIASTARPACPDTVRELETFYQTHYGTAEAEPLSFPSQYPSGCLLGCVTVQDCLPQEEYRKKYPTGESDSPFVFVCVEPQELPIRFPVKGEHKIYMLDSKIHQAAVKALQKQAKQRDTEVEK
ncbi:activating signal cointegrator 1 [Anopheles ziemanni]|uniref:activating signal cointegrator 1 n=1 Tax=Anopheles coustani TaxID=139045 RepID=UPI002659BA38|nr:activating signal cointegrator 1 [Anopheles coustani]XP_058175471.1 activating signal cointegrator 1 [Anopheles ziemanni]